MKSLITFILAIGTGGYAPAATAQAAPPEGVALHRAVTWVDSLPAGPFVRLADGALVTVDGIQLLTSRDEGLTWTPSPLFTDPDRYFVRVERALIRTRNDTLVLAFMNDRERSWVWDTKLGEPGPNVRLPTYVTRSLDHGKTWLPPQLLHEEWTGAIRNLVECEDGTLVFTTMKILRNPGRHGCLTYRSKDDGKTWQASNLIDLGGHGHHDGALEPAVMPLRDGRIWMLIRTTFGVFYEAYSRDGGLTWGAATPTPIDAATAPPMLLRLRSGRLLLAWNRANLEGHSEHPRRGGDHQWSARPASNQRQELSIAFSENDGASWSKPVVVIRAGKRDTSYPYLFEVQPGQIWLTTMRQTVKVHLRESDFAGTTSAAAPAIPIVPPAVVADTSSRR
ncbi:MAG: sialidase family protein [Opitutaceae bacterium]